MRITTHIKSTEKRLDILGSVMGQMSDGIWENTRSMEKYWKNLISTSGPIWRRGQSSR